MMGRSRAMNSRMASGKSIIPLVPSTPAYRSGILEVVKKYREAPVAKKGSLLAFKNEFKADNRSKEDRTKQLRQVEKRITEKGSYVTLQQRVKTEEHNKARWVEDEYKRVRIENSCLNIESKKLRSQIEDMRNDIATMITDDDSKRLYFEQGMPTSAKHQSNYSDIYTMTTKNARTIKHDGHKPKTDVVYKKVGRMGNYTGSPDKKVNDTFKSDHRRFEKVKDVVDTEPMADSKSAFGQSDDGAKTCNLLNRVKMGSQKPSKVTPALKNILTGIHKPAVLKSPTMFGNRGTSRTKGFFKSHDAANMLNIKKDHEDSINMTRSRMTLLGQSRPTSKTNMKRKMSSNITFDLPRSKADHVLDRIDNMAKDYFGAGYIDWIAGLNDINIQILDAEKKIKNKRKYDRMSILIVLNIALCFKRAFYILKFHDSIIKQKGDKSSQTLETQSADLGIRVELEQTYDRVANLAIQISEYSKTLINPALYQSLEPIKLMKVMRREDSLSSVAPSKCWTQNSNYKRLDNVTTESADFNGMKAIEASMSHSAISTPHSSLHLRALEPHKRRIKVYNASTEMPLKNFRKVSIPIICVAYDDLVKEFQQEETLIENIEQKKHYKTIIDLTKVVKKVETLNEVNHVAVFPEEKRDLVMSILNTKPAEVGQSGHIRGGIKNLLTPQPKPSAFSKSKQMKSKYTLSNSRLSSPKTLAKR